MQGRTPGSAPEDMESIISMKGTLGPNPAELLKAVMSSVADNLQTQMVEKVCREGHAILEPGEWCMVLEPGSDRITGRIRLRVASTGQARQLEDSVQGTPVMI